MNRRQKIGASCAVVAALVILGVAAVLVWGYFSLEKPIPGWQNDPSAPHTPPTVSVSPFPSASTHRG